VPAGTNKRHSRYHESHHPYSSPLFQSSVPADTWTTPLSTNGDVSTEAPLRVLIAGAGVGGLALANDLKAYDTMQVRVVEQTAAFKRFGGPIQLASNALAILRDQDATLYNQIMQRFTTTGDKMNGIKDGIRTEWYTEFDLKGPAASRNLPFTGVIDRPDLQELQLQALPEGTVHNGDGVESYQQLTDGTIQVTLQSGKQLHADVVIGADGIWSAIRATMKGTPRKGVESGVAYSGYTVFAGELAYDSPDNGQVGYKVYIGPGQVRQKKLWQYKHSLTLLLVLCHYRHWQGQLPMVCLFGSATQFGRYRRNAQRIVPLPPKCL